MKTFGEYVTSGPGRSRRASARTSSSGAARRSPQSRAESRAEPTTRLSCHAGRVDRRGAGSRSTGDGLARRMNTRRQEREKGGAMRFLFLIHGDTEGEAALSVGDRRAIVEQHFAFADMLRERGAHVAGEALEAGDSAAVVRPGSN